MTSAGHKEDKSRWKPKEFADYLTLGEVAELVGRDRSRIRRAETTGMIAAPIRVKVGRLRVRLYSPEEVRAIVSYFYQARPGRPKGS